MARTQWAGGLWQAAAWGIFGLGYAAAVYWTVDGLHASAGDVVLVVTAGGRLGQYVAMTVGEVDFVRLWLDACRRLGWLENYAALHRGTGDRPAPASLADGIAFEDVSFCYPGAAEPVLRHVSVKLPARLGRGDRRRERGGQEHPGQVALRLLRPVRRAHPGRRH